MDDREMARRAVDAQKRARDYRLVDIPGYMEWSRRKLEEGESSALIAHLDTTSMWPLSEELEEVTEADFEDMLEDLRIAVEGA